MAKVGYIGLGIMGGVDCAQPDESRARTGRPQPQPRDCRSTGERRRDRRLTRRKKSPQQVEFVFTNLPDSPDVEQVVLGKDGIIEGAHAGLVFIDNSTIKPETARMIAEKLAAVGVAGARCPGQRRRRGRAQRHADDHGRRAAGGVRPRRAAVSGDGQSLRAGRRQRRGADRQSLQPDHRRRADGRAGGSADHGAESRASIRRGWSMPSRAARRRCGRST